MGRTTSQKSDFIKRVQESNSTTKPFIKSVRPVIKPKRQSLKSRENHWKPKDEIDRYDSKTTIVLGDPKGRVNYFRGFSMSYSIPRVPNTFQSLPKKEKQRLIELIPHRMKKTMRLYGVSPLVLLKTRDPKPVGAKVNSFRQRQVDKDKESELEPMSEQSFEYDRSNLRGPEIAPNFGENNEFHNVEDLNSKNAEEQSIISQNIDCNASRESDELEQVFERSRLNGPEIAPNFSETNEFDI